MRDIGLARKPLGPHLQESAAHILAFYIQGAGFPLCGSIRGDAWLWGQNSLQRGF